MTGKMSRSVPPTHPGEILREDVLPALDLSELAAATEMKVRVDDLREILWGKRPVDAEWALRLGRFCGNGPGFWMDMQAAADLWSAELRIGKELAAIPTHICISSGRLNDRP
jgi:addiction module HigA family antidote